MTFFKDIAKYEGRKDMVVEIVYSYGEYEFSIYSFKVEEQSNVPIEDGPNHRILGQETPENLIKEIRFLK